MQLKRLQLSDCESCNDTILQYIKVDIENLLLLKVGSMLIPEKVLIAFCGNH